MMKKLLAVVAVFVASVMFLGLIAACGSEPET